MTTTLKLNTNRIIGQYGNPKQRIRSSGEIKSWRSYMQKHSGAYGWIETNPNELSDGDKLNILRDILSTRGESC